jgi:O-antigen/teichoic acid export membrane protein
MLQPFRSKRLVQFAKNTLTLFVGSKFQAVFLFIQSIIVARSLGVAQFGKWAIVVSLCGLAMNILTFRTVDVLGKFFVELRMKKDFVNLGLIIKKTLYLELFMRSLAMGLILVMALVAVNLFKGPEGLLIYFFYGMSFFFQFIGAIWFCLERDNSNYRTIAVLSSFRALIRLLLIVVLFVVLQEITLLALSVSFFLSSLGIMTIKIIRSNKLLSDYGHLSLRIIFLSPRRSSPGTYSVLREYWQFVKASYFSNFFSSIIKKMDILAIGYFFSSESVGLVRLAKNLSKFIQDFAINMAKPLYQEFNELISAGLTKKLYIFLKKNLKLYLGILFLFVFLASLFIEPFIKTVYGNEFIMASAYFRLYLFIVFIIMGSFWADLLVLSLNGWDFRLKILFFATLFYICAVYGLNYFWGIAGIVIANIFTRFLISSSYFLYIKKKIGHYG